MTLMIPSIIHHPSSQTKQRLLGQGMYVPMVLGLLNYLPPYVLFGACFFPMGVLAYLILEEGEELKNVHGLALTMEEATARYAVEEDGAHENQGDQMVEEEGVEQEEAQHESSERFAW